MDASTRRTVLTTAAILAFAATAFAGGYTFGQVSDGERTGASIRAASDFGESPTAAEVVSFRGCGQIRLRTSENASFSLAVTLVDASTDARKTVTLTDADAESEASGFRYASGPGRYQFAPRGSEGAARAGDKILAAKLDGERVENGHRCAEVERRRTGASAGRGPSSGTATTVGNTPTEDADLSAGASGGDEQGDAGDDSSEPGATDTDNDIDTDTDTAATPVTTTSATTETTTRTATTVTTTRTATTVTTAEPPPDSTTTTEATTATPEATATTPEAATTSKATSQDES